MVVGWGYESGMEDWMRQDLCLIWLGSTRSERFNYQSCPTDLWGLPELTGRATTEVIAEAIRRKVTERLIWTMLNKEMSVDECKVNEGQPGESGTWVEVFISKCSHPWQSRISGSGARKSVDSRPTWCSTMAVLEIGDGYPQDRSSISWVTSCSNIVRNRFDEGSSIYFLLSLTWLSECVFREMMVLWYPSHPKVDGIYRSRWLMIDDVSVGEGDGYEVLNQIPSR